MRAEFSQKNYFCKASIERVVMSTTSLDISGE
jgi:hypothetical protein